MRKLQIELSPDQFVTIQYALRKAIIYTEFFDPTHNHYTITEGEIATFLDSYKELYEKMCNLLGWPEKEFRIKCMDLNAKIIERKE